MLIQLQDLLQLTGKLGTATCFLNISKPTPPQKKKILPRHCRVPRFSDSLFPFLWLNTLRWTFPSQLVPSRQVAGTADTFHRLFSWFGQSEVLQKLSK